MLQTYLEAEITRFLYFSNYFLSHRRSSGARTTVIPRRRAPLTERSRRPFIGITKACVVDERLSATSAVTAINRPANVLTLSAGRIVWILWIRSTRKKKRKRNELRSSLLSFLNVETRNDDNQPVVAYTFRILPVPLLQRYS